MRLTLTFKDNEEENNYASYQHKNEFFLFKRLLVCMLIGSFSGSLYFIIIGDYLYIILGSYMFLQTILAIYLSQKSMTYLNIVAFWYQLEIQTLLAALITLLDNTLERGTIMIVTSAAFQMSVCLSIGTKVLFKLFINLYSTIFQIYLSSRIEQLSLIWIGFSFFSLLFSLQSTYYQEYEKRIKYTLHQNSERIRINIINQIDTPIFKCSNKEQELKLEFIEGNSSAYQLFKIADQTSFNKFIREATALDLKTSLGLTRQLSFNIATGCTLETALRKFFLRQLEDEQLITKQSSGYKFRVKYNNFEFQCQVVLLFKDVQPYCIVYFSRTYDEQLNNLQKKLQHLNLLLKRSTNDTLRNIYQQQKIIKKLFYHSQFITNQNIQDLIKKLDQITYQSFLFFANCKLFYNQPHLNEKYLQIQNKINIKTLLLETLIHFRFIIEKKKIKIQLFQQNQVCEIIGNIIFIRQLFSNIIENALDHGCQSLIICIKQDYDQNIFKQYITISFSNEVECHQNNISRQKEIQLGNQVNNKILYSFGRINQIKIETDKNKYAVICSFFKQL